MTTASPRQVIQQAEPANLISHRLGVAPPQGVGWIHFRRRSLMQCENHGVATRHSFQTEPHPPIPFVQIAPTPFRATPVHRCRYPEKIVRQKRRSLPIPPRNADHQSCQRTRGADRVSTEPAVLRRCASFSAARVQLPKHSHERFPRFAAERAARQARPPRDRP
jgi:hypothetical protein